MMMDIILSLLMLAGFALIAGAAVMVRRGGWSRKPALMLVLAVIMFANAAILSIPNDRGLAPATTDIDG